jgi:hypothetical protein
VSVSTIPRAPSLRSLLLAWVCFSFAFNTVFQAFLTTFLINSGYKTPIRNLDELFASGIKLAYHPAYSHILRTGDETEVSKVKKNRANCPSYWDCVLWAKYHKNISILVPDIVMEAYYATGFLLGEYSEPLMCGLEDDVVYNGDRRMVMLQGDPLMRRVTEIIDRVFEAGIYNFWISLQINRKKYCILKNLPLARLMDITASSFITCKPPSTSY